MQPYIITETNRGHVPILVSVPHCGTQFPDDIKDNYHQTLIDAPDDTDWYVDELYNFVAEMGIPMIRAKYSRWVIDLNRDPKSKPLYNDGRIITGLCTTTDFNGNAIYAKNEPDEEEVNRRVDRYYAPYHSKIQEMLNDIKKEFGKVLLWDAHSIRQFVPTIQKDKFPDMILGSADETSAHPALIAAALKGLGTANVELKHNFPFKGGQITRSFGMPSKNQHALQLEMNKILYMDDKELTYSTSRANKVREVLKTTFKNLITTLETL
ncbi:MAG: N-formylglutamate amidohydrolase [Cyclobacteriaceae bacterium]|nr:N-formylglutamate amidohydrolase [Cyclobacteriaceae bacterium]